MVLIRKPIEQSKSEVVRVKLDAELKQDIDTYCAWQQLPSPAYFLMQAALEVLRSDKDWKQYKKERGEHSIIES